VDSNEELLAHMADLNDQPEQLADRLGIALTEVGPGRVVGTLPVSGNRQPYGMLHGGASVALAETLGSIAAAVHAGRQRIAVGVDINATHHRAARTGVITGVCTPLHEGSRVASYEILLTDEEGRRVCTARLTCALLQRPPGT
jgi:1,4-dihydroxy-2-naphthoyl-CoA hydrolase